MIDFELRYPGRVNASSAGYPGGSFKNETTPGVSNDGTPLEQDWQNDHQGAFLAVLDAAGMSPDDSIEQVGASQFLAAIQYLISNAGYLNNSVMVGAVQTFYRATPPTGWLVLNGQTIGGASSGATARANADTEELYTQIWTASTVANIFDSGGSATTRGASAAQDFAANKRLELVDVQGDFLRAYDGGNSVDPDVREIGDLQLDEFKSHTHTINVGSNETGGSYTRTVNNNDGTRTSSAAGGDETRPRNRAFLVCVKY